MMDVDGTPIKLQLWDTAGTENFRSVTRSFYRNANAILLMYNICDRASFENCRMWLEELR
jgi:GTPase SAR1 family protein